jgi:hypothetical protein
MRSSRVRVAALGRSERYNQTTCTGENREYDR